MFVRILYNSVKLSISSQFCIQSHHFSSLKLTMIVFMPKKLANPTKHSFLFSFPEWLLNIYQQTMQSIHYTESTGYFKAQYTCSAPTQKF